ncbi:hypothetical protein Y032_0364g3551 [Ancylostoma ceylanicum]|uniref:Uncharacterized protein n=1 Tax=Ancylostoma ceylanicum TaxID=53326 RepID=A0A016RV55_9BILA|nr:hypothetical protein Y032_0364g3551 [Ancylostoma ceylanicum]
MKYEEKLQEMRLVIGLEFAELVEILQQNAVKLLAGIQNEMALGTELKAAVLRGIARQNEVQFEMELAVQVGLQGETGLSKPEEL